MPILGYRDVARHWSALRFRMRWLRSTDWMLIAILNGSAHCHRIVTMLTHLISRLNVVAEPETSYNTAIDYEYEYRDAEYEYDEGREARTKPCT